VSAHPELGPNLARGIGTYLVQLFDGDVLEVTGDDSYHILAPGETERTLCGHTLDEVCFAFSMDSGYKPDSGSGCWTCLEASNRWATA
jgi:hypothetical protein